MAVSIYRPTICVDFDGTVVDHDWPRTGPLNIKPGVKEALLKLHELDFKIVIYSCRSNLEAFGSDMYFKEMQAFLQDNDIYYDEIATVPKPLAVWYIDDKAIPYRENWADIAEYIAEEHEKYLKGKHNDSDSEETDNTPGR